MENCSRKQYESIKKALKRVGLKVDEIVKRGKKTVITVFRYETNENMAINKENKRRTSK